MRSGDPGFDGANWPAMREKDAAFVPDLARRSDRCWQATNNSM